MKECSWYANVP